MTCLMYFYSIHFVGKLPEILPLVCDDVNSITGII